MLINLCSRLGLLGFFSPTCTKKTPSPVSVVAQDAFRLSFDETKTHIKLSYPNASDEKKEIKRYENTLAKIFFRIIGVSTNITLGGKKLCLNKEELRGYFFEIAKRSLSEYEIKEDIKTNQGDKIFHKGEIVSLDLEKVKDVLIQDFFRKVKTNGFEKEISNFVNRKIRLDEDFIKKTAVNNGMSSF